MQPTITPTFGSGLEAMITTENTEFTEIYTGFLRVLCALCGYIFLQAQEISHYRFELDVKIKDQKASIEKRGDS